MSRLFRAHEADEYFFEEGCFVLELLNDPADPDASIARARVPAGGSTRHHHLVDVTERYLVQSGEGDVEIGDEVFPVRSGDAVLIPPGVRQRVTNTGSGDLVFLAICTPRFRPECYRDG